MRCTPRVLAFLFLATLHSPVLHAQGVPRRGATPVPALSDEARHYLAAALDSIQQASMHAASADWQAVRDSAFLLAAGAQRPAQTYGAINWALRRVDRHSFLQARFPWVEPELVAGRVGYLRIPTHTVGSAAVLADTLQHVLRRLEAEGACGWIVDLRMNGGGNVWPMYAGIGPLLGDSVLNATLVAGRVVPGALYLEGVAFSVEADGRRIEAARAAQPHRLRQPGAPVAVLIDGGTASSAEAIAIAFRTRPETRFFGQPTAGYTTGNRGIGLADGANLVVTFGAMTDRHGREYAAPLEPDESVPLPPGVWPASSDAVARRASDWVTSQRNCR